MQEPSSPLAFPGVMVVVGGGTVDFALLRALQARGAALVGADGGGDVIAAAGLVPDAIIGDLDSLADKSGWPAATRVLHLTEQLTTDFQKVLYSTRAPLTLALGMTGKRFDHTLAAISAVTEYARERAIVLVDESDIALGVSGALRLALQAGARVSIYPLLPIDFLGSEGLLYPLQGLHMEAGGLIGTSNEAMGGMVAIEPADDTPWLLILERGHLWVLMDEIAGLP